MHFTRLRNKFIPWLVVATACALAPLVACAQDLGTETVNPVYTRLRLTRLRLHCQTPGIADGVACAQVLEHCQDGRCTFPEVPGTGNRSVIPRPRNPSMPEDTIDEQDLSKSGTSLNVNAAEVGFPRFDISFELGGTRLRNDLVRWEGFTPQPDFCIVQDLGTFGGGIRTIRIKGVGGNFCTHLSQSSSPEDHDGLRYYKTLDNANDPACNVADRALHDAIEANADERQNAISLLRTRGRNFLLIRARTIPVQPQEREAYDRLLRDLQAAATAENDRRQMRCRDFDASRRASDPECAPVRVPSSTILFPDAASCHRYPLGVGSDEINIVASVEEAAATAGREPSRAASAPVVPHFTLPGSLCRGTVTPPPPREPETVSGRVIVSRPAGIPTNADDQFEVARAAALGSTVRLRSTAGSGITFSPSEFMVSLTPGRTQTTPFRLTVGSVNGDPNFSGSVELLAESSDFVETGRSPFSIITTDAPIICHALPELDSLRSLYDFSKVKWPIDPGDPALEWFKTVDLKAMGPKGLAEWNRIWPIIARTVPPDPPPLSAGPPAGSTILMPEQAFLGGVLTGVVLGPDDKPIANTPVQIAAGGVPGQLSGEVIGELSQSNSPGKEKAGYVEAGKQPNPGEKAGYVEAGKKPNPLATCAMDGAKSTATDAAHDQARALVAGSPDAKLGNLANVVRTDANGRFALCVSPDASKVSVALPSQPTSNAAIPTLVKAGIPTPQPPFPHPPEFVQPNQKFTLAGLITKGGFEQNGKQGQVPVAMASSSDGTQSISTFKAPHSLQPGLVKWQFTGASGQQTAFTSGVFQILRASLDRSKLRSNEGADFEYEVLVSPESIPNGLCVDVKLAGPIAMVRAPSTQVLIDASGHGKFGGKIRATSVTPGSTVPFDISTDFHGCKR